MLQGVRGDSAARADSEQGLMQQLDNLHKQIVPGFIVGYNARLKHRCLTQYQSSMSDLSSMQTMQEFESKHHESRVAGRQHLQQVRLCVQHLKEENLLIVCHANTQLSRI